MIKKVLLIDRNNQEMIVKDKDKDDGFDNVKTIKTSALGKAKLFVLTSEQSPSDMPNMPVYR